MYASVFIGVLGFLAAEYLGYPLVGLVVYWAGFLGFFGIWKGTSVQLYDERDAALERRASLVTIQIAGVIAVLLMTTLVVVETTNAMEVPPRVWGGFLTLSGLFILYGVVYLSVRYRR
jgi:uncharacterized membrane protein